MSKKPNIEIKKILFRLVKRGRTHLICLRNKHYSIRNRKGKQYLYGKPKSCDGSCGMPNKISVHDCNGVDDKILAKLKILPVVPRGCVLVDRKDIHPAGTPITLKFAYWLDKGYSSIYRNGEKFTLYGYYENWDRCSKVDGGFSYRSLFEESAYEVVNGKVKILYFTRCLK